MVVVAVVVGMLKIILILTFCESRATLLPFVSNSKLNLICFLVLIHCTNDEASTQQSTHSCVLTTAESRAI